MGPERFANRVDLVRVLGREEEEIRFTTRTVQKDSRAIIDTDASVLDRIHISNIIERSAQQMRQPPLISITIRRRVPAPSEPPLWDSAGRTRAIHPIPVPWSDTIGDWRGLLRRALPDRVPG